MRTWILGALLATATLGVATGMLAKAADTPTTQPSQAAGVLSYTMKDIDGHDVPLSKYQGDVILLLNVASYCGNTPQYTALEKLYEKNKAHGFTILGFPANNFGSQEPGTDKEIKEFCTSKYQVSFPIFSKISVKGSDKAPLYQYLTVQETAPQKAGEITWNFEKFLIGRNGKVVARFAPKTQPDDPMVLAAIEHEIAQPKP